MRFFILICSFFLSLTMPVFAKTVMNANEKPLVLEWHFKGYKKVERPGVFIIFYKRKGELHTLTTGSGPRLNKAIAMRVASLKDSKYGHLRIVWARAGKDELDDIESYLTHRFSPEVPNIFTGIAQKRVTLPEFYARKLPPRNDCDAANDICAELNKDAGGAPSVPMVAR